MYHLMHLHYLNSSVCGSASRRHTGSTAPHRRVTPPPTMRTTTALFALLFSTCVAAQPTFEVEFEELPLPLVLRVNLDDPGCGDLGADGTAAGVGSVGIRLDFPFDASGGAAGIIEDLLALWRIRSGGSLLNAADLVVDFTASVGCSFWVSNTGGSVEAYVANGSPQVSLEKRVSGGVSFSESITVNVPEATTIELPVHASVSLVSGSTFVDPSESLGIASGNVIASLGGVSTYAGDVLRNETGELVIQGGTDETNYVQLNVPAGVSTHTLSVNGTLSAYSRVRAASPFLPAAMNTGANAGNSLRVGPFTGPSGTPLPEGTSIRGVTSGITYAVGATATRVEDTPGASGMSLTLLGPNPTAGRTSLVIRLPELGEVTIETFDLLGRRVLPVHRRFLPAGLSEHRLDASQLPSGLYFIHVTTVDSARTTRLVVSRQ